MEHSSLTSRGFADSHSLTIGKALRLIIDNQKELAQTLKQNESSTLDVSNLSDGLLESLENKLLESLKSDFENSINELKSELFEYIDKAVEKLSNLTIDDSELEEKNTVPSETTSVKSVGRPRGRKKKTELLDLGY